MHPGQFCMGFLSIFSGFLYHHNDNNPNNLIMDCTVIDHEPLKNAINIHNLFLFRMKFIRVLEDLPNICSKIHFKPCKLSNAILPNISKNVSCKHINLLSGNIPDMQFLH